MSATTLRPNQGFTAKATVTRGDIQLVSWIIFSGHNSDASNILEIHPKIGLELDHSFSVEGKFRLAAYHKEIQTKEDYQSTAELKHVDVEVKYNQLDGTKLVPKNPANFVSGDILRKNFPCVFEAKFLIDPASSDELSRLKFSLSDGSRNTLHEGSQAGSIFTFTPQNSNAKYIVTAEYTNEFGAVSTQSFSGTSKALSVKDITHGEQVVRPGTPMSFSVTKTQFNFSVKNDSDLPENGSIKWNLDKVLIGTGRTINITGSRLMQKKKYHIEAFVTSAIGKTTGTNNDGINNDWHFEVKDNIVEKIKIVKSPKMGTAGEFEIEETTFKNYDPAKDGAISWKVTGPETGTGSEAKFSKSFNLPGEYTISCNLGGRPCKEPLKIKIIEPMVTVDQCKWIDKDSRSGNIIKQAGLNQEISAFVSGNGLDNEDITLDIYDDDSTGNNIVFTYTFKTTEKHKTGFYFPLTITQQIVDKIKEHGFADRGDLYFNLVRNGAETPIKNGDKKLGKFLRVTLDPQIINAYFCDANDTEQVFSSPLNGALYFKIYAINMVDKKVEINFLTESDAYWTWDDELKIGKWENIKDKFKDEKIRDTKTATFDKKGEILVPVDLSKMGKPKNFIRLNAMVKILKDEEAKEKQEEKGFYIKHTDLAILFPGATLPTMVENKGAVKVGRAEIDGGKQYESKCPRCEAKITIDEFKQIFPDVSKVFDKGINKLKSTTLSQFTDSLNRTLVEFKINTCIKKAFFLSQIAKETGFFSRIDENLDYRTESALHTFWTKESHPKIYTNPSTYFKNPEKLGNYVYRNVAENGDEASGDGYKYRGRGLIQITRKKGYRRFSEYDKNPSILSNPDLLLEDLNLMTRSAGWYWKHGVLLKNGSERDINDVAQTGDFTETTRLVHGGTRDIKDRTNILNKIKPVLKTDECKIGQTDNKPDILSDADIEYHIYYNGGEIHYKLHNPKREIAEYFYHDTKGNIHKLGKIKLKKVKDKYGGSYKDKLQNSSNIYLADIRDIKSYSKNGVVFKLAMNTGKHSRYYLNDVTMASLIGAILDLSFPDFTFNGFSDSEGRSVGGSNSHKNGMNGDLRYLRKDKSGKNVHLTLNSETGDPCGWKGMDETRQNQFNDTLHKYGWKSMLSWKFDNGRLLHYSSQYDDHYHHLHVQSYKPILKEIK